MIMIETERLHIYPASENQMKSYISAEKDEEMKKAYTEMLEGCLTHPDQWNWYAMWIIELKDGTHIGDLCFKGLEPNGAAEIGYGILEEYQRKGYATEAVKAAVKWAFQDPKVTAIEAETEPDNRASQRVLEKCGFVPNGKNGKEGPRFSLMPSEQKPDFRIRTAEIEDTARLLEIYGYYVKNTAITFEYDVPEQEEFAARITNTLQKYPYLVLEAEGVIQGYSYAGPFVGRAAYSHSCEVTIYLDKNAKRKGYGRLLYEALENKLKAMGILNLYARIGSPVEEDEYLTKNSEKFHEHLGFVKVGEFHKCGCKFNRWYNMICMEKIIGVHDERRNDENSQFSLGMTAVA